PVATRRRQAPRARWGRRAGPDSVVRHGLTARIHFERRHQLTGPVEQLRRGRGQLNTIGAVPRRACRREPRSSREGRGGDQGQVRAWQALRDGIARAPRVEIIDGGSTSNEVDLAEEREAARRRRRRNRPSVVYAEAVDALVEVATPVARPDPRVATGLRS